MTESKIQERATTASERWRERIGEQERSGLLVRKLCEERALSEHSFYQWRKRRRKQEPVRFALVDREEALAEAEPALELVLASGERLRIGAGVDGAVLRTVLDALRA